MNVLQVNTVYPFGSTGHIAAEIAAYTADQSDASALVAFGIGEPLQRNSLTAVRIGCPWERKLHGVIRKLFDAEGYGSHFATEQLIRFCEENAVDVVHLHNLHGCYINLKRWFRYLKRNNVPVIWTLHDCWPLTGHCAHFSYSGCGRWKTLCRRCPQKAEYPTCIGIGSSKRNYRLKKRLFTEIDNLTIVTPCRWLQEIVRESFLGGAPSRVIYNGVDTNRFRPVTSNIRFQYGLDKRKLLLSMASVWNDRKGLVVLRELSQILDDDYRLVVIGLTLDQIRSLPANILGLEHIASQVERCAWYSAADCFVNPTLEDTMPLVNLEALACGTPVVTFDTGGCPEAIDDSCGLIVVQGDIRGLKDAVTKICESGTNYTGACLKQAERFTMRNTVRAYYDLYREVLK